MIEISQLTFRYPRSEFELVIDSLAIEAGEKVAIVGPSGSGKTTLLQLIAGILLPDSGSIRVDQQPLTQLSDRKRRDFRISQIGLVFQRFELIEYLNGMDNIRVPFAINPSLSWDRSIDLRVQELADAMGIAGKLKRHPNQLSQGEQQRVAICRALVTKPSLILADEPTGNLDPSNKQKILEILFEQASQNQQTLVVVTHDLGVVDRFDRAIDFNQFCVARSDSSDEQEATA